MPIRVRTPDGSVAVFPDGTDDATITRVMAAEYGGPKAKPKVAGGFLPSLNAQIPLGDELVAGVYTALDLAKGKGKVDPSRGPIGGAINAFQNQFNANMGALREREANYKQVAPKRAALGRGLGLAAGAAIPTGQTANAFAQGSRAVNMVRGATTAGLTAAGYAAADRGTVRERVGAASKAATDPLTLALGAAGGAIAPAARKPKAVKTPAPTLDELSTQKNAAYQAVDQSGVRYSPQAMDGMVADITQDVTAQNLNPARHPKAASMLEDLQAMKGSSPTLTELDQMRQVIRRDVASSNDPAEAFFGQRMIRKLDEFIDAAGPEQVVSGSATDASGMLRTARDLNTRVRKIDAIETGLEEAKYQAGKTGSGGNVNNAIRQQMDRIRRDTPNLTEEEAALMEKIIIGSKGQNTLRQVGKLSPQGNGLMTALSIGGAAANPILAVPTAAGALSKVAADKMTERDVRRLVEMIARGGSPAAQQALQQAAAMDPAVAALLRELSARTSRAAGAAGGQNAFAPGANP